MIRLISKSSWRIWPVSTWTLWGCLLIFIRKWEI
jgi:hypothetical protein